VKMEGKERSGLELLWLLQRNEPKQEDSAEVEGHSNLYVTLYSTELQLLVLEMMFSIPSYIVTKHPHTR